MESKRQKLRDATRNVLESNGFLAFGFAFMAAVVVMLIGQYLTRNHFDADAAPWPVEHFFVTALIAAGIVAPIAWYIGTLLPSGD